MPDPALCAETVSVLQLPNPKAVEILTTYLFVDSTVSKITLVRKGGGYDRSETVLRFCHLSESGNLSLGKRCGAEKHRDIVWSDPF